MSDSDDTDVLLLIPPDLFLVPSSSDSDISSDRIKTEYNTGRTGVISELVEHMQSLESRISVIESKDNSLDATLLNNSLDSQIQAGTTARFRQTLPRTRFSVSQSSSLQNSPVKPRQSMSVPSTPSGYSLNRTNPCQNDITARHHFPAAVDTNIINTNSHDKCKHDLLVSYSDSSVIPALGLPHVAAIASKGKPYPCTIDNCKNTSNLYIKPQDQSHSMPSESTLPSTTRQLYLCSKSNVQEMELSEVDELLQEMEATELELSKRINSVSVHQHIKGPRVALPTNQMNDTPVNEEEKNIYRQCINKKLEFEPHSSRLQYYDPHLAACPKKHADTFPDISLPYDSFYPDETDKMISEFKTWDHSVQQPIPISGEHKIESTNTIKNVDNTSDKSVVKLADTKRKEFASEQSAVPTDHFNSRGVDTIPAHKLHKNEDTIVSNELKKHNVATLPKHIEYKTSCLAESCTSQGQQSDNMQNIRETMDIPFARCTAHVATNTDFLTRKSQRLLSLSDFWDNNRNKSQEEMLSIKLEEEKFRREHCEYLIQELQKRLLEQQEKVAVALRVDNEKNQLITQFHSAWSKLKQRVHMLESEYQNLQTNLTNVTEKHQAEVTEFQSQIKRCESELSKALDLAAGYKEKSDGMIKEKVDSLKSHADELESYKSLVQEAENRYEQLKVEYNKLLEKSQQTEETTKNLQQELSKERLKGGEVRNEMNVIHKALDTCEAELIILRQEKENLQLKLKEEINRNSILEHKNAMLLSSVDDANNAQKLAKEEAQSLIEQKEKIRSDLQEVYQKQVDAVVKEKLQEFQMQLDTAEFGFLEELKTRQQVIAECAARKIKDVIDKHKLEINLLEEKQKEEKRLYELQLAQAAQKSSFLETQLNSQRATKSQLAEQLHCVMQKQWQQALQIISGGNLENLTPLQRIHAEKIFESRVPKKSESVPNCYVKVPQEPMRLTSQLSEEKIFHGRREEQNESMSTITPINHTPLTSRKEVKDDLRNYIRMIAEMQQPKEELTIREHVPSPPLACREVPRKHYMKKELSIMSEDSITWQPVSETSAHDTSEFIPISQKLSTKMEQQKNKPPWK